VFGNEMRYSVQPRLPNDAQITVVNQSYKNKTSKYTVSQKEPNFETV